MIRRLLPVLLLGGILSITIIGLPSTAGAVPIPWTNCGSAGDLISVSRADASVWPPQAGQSITLRVQFNLARNIAGGYAVLTVTPPPERQTVRSHVAPRSFGPAQPLILHLGPAQAGPSNPFGPNGITFTVPSSAATKTFHVDFDAHDTTGARLICLQMVVPIKPGSSTDAGGGQGTGQGDTSLTLQELFAIFSRAL